MDYPWHKYKAINRMTPWDKIKNNIHKLFYQIWEMRMKKKHGRCTMKDKIFTFGQKQLIFFGGILHRGIQINFESWYKRPDKEIYKYPSMGINFGFIFVYFGVTILDSKEI